LLQIREVKKITITAQLGRALAVVKVTSQVNGNTQFSGSHHPKIISAIDYAGEGNPQPTFRNDRITADFSPYRWNIAFRRSPNNLGLFSVMLFNKPAEQTHEPILTSNIS